MSVLSILSQAITSLSRVRGESKKNLRPDLTATQLYEARQAQQLLLSRDTVFFDIDGTLVDSNEFHVLAWDRAFRRNGRSISRHLLREQIGKGADLLIPSLIPDASKAERKALTDAHSEVFKRCYLSSVKPFPFAGDLIRALAAQRKRVLLVSSSDKKEIRHYARLLNVQHVLSGTVGFDDVKQTKPAGDLFAVALQRAGAEAKAAIAVGDTPYDVEAAAKQGVGAIALRSGGFTDSQLSASSPIAIVNDVSVIEV